MCSLHMHTTVVVRNVHISLVTYPALIVLDFDDISAHIVAVGSGDKRSCD